MNIPEGQRKNGFTIVELIVVIAIIGILAGISIVGFKRYQADTRDARRSSSITSIAEALEKYYDINGEYPSCSALSATGTSVSQTTLKGINQSTLIAPQANSADTNSIKCTSSGNVLNSGGVDFFEYQGDGSTNCNGSGSCLQFVLKYKDEGSGTVKTISSRRSITIADLSVNGMTRTSITLGWTAIQDATTYTLQSSTDSGFVSNLTQVTTSTSVGTISGLTAKTNYYFRVVPIANRSNMWSNTVQQIPDYIVTTFSTSVSTVPGIAVDSAGTVYDTSPSYSIRKTTTAGVVTTLAGSGVAGYANGTGSAAQFAGLEGIAIDSAGTIYASDLNNQRIRKITAAGVVTTLAGSGVAGYANGTGSAAQFAGLEGIAIDSAGTVYASDLNNQRIRKITAAGVVTTLAGSGVAGYANGTGSAAQFADPWGIAVDSSGTVYVAENSNYTIRKITPAGVVTTLAGSGGRGFIDGAGSTAQFNNPSGVAVDSSGTVYVADTFNNRIRKITSSGVVSTLAGSAVAGYADGTGSAATLNNPGGITVDSLGTLYVTDYGNNCIRKITSAGVVTTLAGSTVQGYADGIASVAKFNFPDGIAVDSSGTFYVGDNSNKKIRKIQ